MTFQALTHFDQKFAAIGAISYPILQKYCQKHGYKSHAQTERNCDRFPVWDKIQLVKDSLAQADWTLYMDADAMITNLNIRLENFPLDKDFVIANDVNGLNSGVFLIKNSNWAGNFLDKIWNIDPNHSIYHSRGGWNETEAEQSAMKAIIAEDGDSAAHINFVPQKSLNAYLYHIYGYPAKQDGYWSHGDFIIHLPGLQNKQRIEILQKKVIEIIS